MLSLVQKGISREEAYGIIQQDAMEVWSKGGDLRDKLKEDPRVMSRLSSDEIDSIFDLQYHLKNVDIIFDRVFNDRSKAAQ
jgi:adenylosuccinate lyase